jgi:tellurite methyltransferase
MDRAIAGYHRDEEGEWVAELSCGHNQHVRHRPPFQLREWVLEPESRERHVGTALNCPQCDRAEIPEDVTLVRSGPEWDEHTIPAGLLRAHRIAKGTWGRITVRAGQLHFVAHTEPALDVVLAPGATQAIPPEVPHEVQPLGAVRFSIDFFTISRSHSAKSTPDDDPIDARLGVTANFDPGPAFAEGGESACLAHLLCPECGAVLDGSSHVQGCAAADR